MKQLHRILAGLAALFLLIAAALHSMGYQAVTNVVSGLSGDPIFRRALPAMWLFFSWHLIAFAGAVAWVSLRGATSARLFLIFAAIVCVVDTAFVFHLAGVFIGTIVLALAAVCLVGAAVKWPV
jgi:hypothetical protein